MLQKHDNELLGKKFRNHITIQSYQTKKKTGKSSQILNALFADVLLLSKTK